MAEKRKKAGKTTKLTPQVHAAIVRHVKNGTPQKYAAQAAGIKESVLKDWINRGRREKSGIYSDLANALKEAFGDFVASNAKVIQKAADGVIETTVKETIGPPIPKADGTFGPGLVTERIVTTRKVIAWAAAAWLLERRAQEEFSNAKSELQLLKKQLASTNDKLEALLRVQQQVTSSPVETIGAEDHPVSPVGGEADINSI